MRIFLLLLILLSVSIFCDSSSSESQNLTSSEGKEVEIPSSSEDQIPEEKMTELILEKQKEFDETTTTTEIPYLPLIQRCSIDDDCSSESACYDGKCRRGSKFHFLPFSFLRCKSRLDCPPGNMCIVSRCVPFRW